MKNLIIAQFCIALCLLAFSATLSASSIEISGTYSSQNWVADTVYITGDCIISYSLVISPGTRVIFNGNYLLSAAEIVAEGLINDSIYFMSNVAKCESPAGRIRSYNEPCLMIPCPGHWPENRFSYLDFANLDSITLTFINKSTLHNNSYIYVFDALESSFINNDTIHFQNWVRGSHVSGSKMMKGIAYQGRGNPPEFTIDSSLFEFNESPFEINTEIIVISQNIFRNNKETPIHLQGSLFHPYSKIYNNIFADNSSLSGPGAILIDPKGSALQIENNTFFRNTGHLCGGIKFNQLDIAELNNNIFWGNNSDSGYDISLDVTSGNVFEISNCNLQHGEGSISNPGGITLQFSNIIEDYPEFSDTIGSLDLSLRKTSPAIDAGTMVYMPIDISGKPRTFGKAADIGAYEYIPSEYPEILYQSGDTNLFAGESLILNFTTNDRYDYTWYHNGTLIPNRKDTFFIIDNPILADAGEYSVRVCNLPDTIWSAPMHVHVYSFSRSLLPDSLYLCPDSVVINVEPEEVDYLWSTGDTTQQIIVKETGRYWLRISNSLGLDISDTIIVYRPSSIEISGSYIGNMELCADTLLVVGNCNFRYVTLSPGTFILFKGDYTIMLAYTKSFGTETDSITFCGNVLPTDTIKQGTIVVISCLGTYPVSNFNFSLTNLVNLKYINLCGVNKCSIRECDTVNLGGSSSNKVIRNNIVHFEYSVDNCQVYGNKLLYYHFGYNTGQKSYSFSCTNSTFRRNASGLTLFGYPHYYWGTSLQVENCQFIENAGTIINYNKISSNDYNPSGIYILHNKFYRNTGDILDFMSKDLISTVKINNNEFIENEGLPVACNIAYKHEINNNLFVKNHTSSGPGSIFCSQNDFLTGEILNNTFVSNRGVTFGCIEIISDIQLPIHEVITNNIFWENSATLSEYAAGFTVGNTDIGVSKLSLTHSVAKDTSKIALISGTGFALAQKNSFNLSPEFVDSLNNNFRLSKASPYINAGTGTSGTEDLDKNPRIFGKAIDIGPYEYIPAGYPGFTTSSHDTIVCLNTPVTLKALSDDRYNYNWYKGGQHLAVRQDDTLVIPTVAESDTGYYLASINNLTDTVWSNPIHLVTSDVPVIIDYTSAVEICLNEEAEFIVNTESVIEPVYTWLSSSEGELDETSDLLRITHARHNDTLSASVESYCGSDTSGAMFLNVFSLPEPDLGNDTALYSGDRLLLDAGAVFESYQWSDGTGGPYGYASAGDTAWVIVTDENGCQGSDTMVISLHPVSIGEHASLTEMKLYPNPVEHELFILLNTEIDLPYTMNIFSRDGRLIEKIEVLVKGIQSIKIGELFEPGYYLLQIQSNTFIGTGSFVVE